MLLQDYLDHVAARLKILLLQDFLDSAAERLYSVAAKLDYVAVTI